MFKWGWFNVCSDTHITSLAGENQIGILRFKRMFDQSFTYASKQDFKGINHVFVVGDGADDASIESQRLFTNTVNAMSKKYDVEVSTVLGNHEFTWSTKSYEEIVEDYKSVTGVKTLDFHFKIGDFHFIGLSPRNKNWEYEEKESAPWLEEQLKEAAKDDPSGKKPIFVFQHVGIKDTCYGTDIDYQTYTDEKGEVHDAVLIPALLEKYPQVVHLSAHSHRPISDERMIMQDKYTTITTGALSYFEMDIPGFSANHIFANPDGTYDYHLVNDFAQLDASHFLIIEVSKDGTTYVKPYCIDGNHFVGETYQIDPFTSTSDFIYTRGRKDSSSLPEFNTSFPKITNIGEDDALFEIYQAKHAQSYRCELYLNNELIETKYRVANVQMPTQPETFKLDFTDLDEDSSYNVKIFAINSWGKECLTPLCFDFKTLPN